MPENVQEERPLAYTPTWSVACVLTFFVALSLLMERSIHHLTNRLRNTKRKPLLAALEKMKEELMVLGFISFLLTATPGIISTICIPSKFFNSAFSPCSRSEIAEESEDNASEGHKLSRTLIELNQNNCEKGHEPIVSNEGIEQLHRLIFLMAVTHVAYSCLTMLLAMVKVHTWRAWEDEAHIDQTDHELTREMTRRQSALVGFHQSKPFLKNVYLTWVICFFRQFGNSVVRVDYLTLRKAFIMNHNLTSKYDFHSYMIRSMEEEFQRIVGVSGPLWGVVVGFMIFNVNGSNLYFWMSIIPFAIILVVGAKLQHVIATLALESSGVTKLITGTKLRPRDELFWFKKPEVLLSLIHFTLFQNAFDLASFFWTWWNFGENSCFLQNHIMAYLRLFFGFAGQFLCSYITLPLYALVTQMGTHYKAALIPERVRETIRGWGKAARRRRRFRYFVDDSTVHTNRSSTVLSTEEANSQFDSPRKGMGIELQNRRIVRTSSSQVPGESTSHAATPLLKHSASVSSLGILPRSVARPSSVPVRKD